MNPEVEAARTAALAAGFTVSTVTNEIGRTVHQLADAQGNYLASHTSADGLWIRAFKRGLLPAAS